mmetsp:Transcript_8748/g.17335  ORF Transcript_8748/g.17335 Transcript_8748/m.17335 type:complete len:247 (+) Transcript_8748:721-1461(+)
MAGQEPKGEVPSHPAAYQMQRLQSSDDREDQEGVVPLVPVQELAELLDTPTAVLALPGAALRSSQVQPLEHLVEVHRAPDVERQRQPHERQDRPCSLDVKKLGGQVHHLVRQAQRPRLERAHAWRAQALGDRRHEGAERCGLPAALHHHARNVRAEVSGQLLEAQKPADRLVLVPDSGVLVVLVGDLVDQVRQRHDLQQRLWLLGVRGRGRINGLRRLPEHAHPLVEALRSFISDAHQEADEVLSR